MKFLGKDPNIIDAYYTATAEGAITAGKPVIVEADGDVAEVEFAALTTPTTGSTATFEDTTNSIQNFIGMAYDASADKVVIAYTDEQNSNYGTAVVGSFSGNTLSFGTPVVFSSYTNSKNMGVAYDSANDKAVIAYQVDNQKGYAIVGTVSGTSISFGSRAQYEPSQAIFNQICYSPDDEKVVIMWEEMGSTEGICVVGTVSGTSISFGSETVFDTDRPSGTSGKGISLTYNTSANKVVLAYIDSGNSYRGTSRVGTISGTSISFGTATTFGSSYAQDDPGICSMATNKVVIVYRDDSNSYYGTAIVGTISGTGISFGTPSVYKSSQSNFNRVALNDSDNTKVTIIYRAEADTNDPGRYIVGTVSGTSISFGSQQTYDSAGSQYNEIVTRTGQNGQVIAYAASGANRVGKSLPLSTGSTNLTSENYIGIAADTYADNEDSTIGIVGCIDRNQTGLTAGQQYFVQNDGTLSTTAGDPSVLAGTAISATELVVKE